MPTVTSRRVTFAPSKDAAMSAPKAGPPVTCTVRSCGARSRTRSRIVVTVVAFVALSGDARIGTWTIAANPSCDVTGGPDR